MTEFLSENQILERYGIQESTLTHVVDLGLLPDSEKRRGRIVYPLSDFAKTTLEASKLYFTEVASETMRLLPFQRAYICMAIAEGPHVAYQTLFRRGFFDYYTEKDANRRWQAFVKKLPKQAVPFMTGETDELDPMSERIMRILEITEAYETPDILKIPELYEHLEIVGDLNGMLLAGADHLMVAAAMLVLHQVEVEVPVIEHYVHYYFDHRLLTNREIIEHANRHSKTSHYRRMLECALTSKDYTEFVVNSKLPLKLDQNAELLMALNRLRPGLTVKVCGRETARQQAFAVNAAIKILDHMDHHAEVEEEIGDEDDLLRLRHEVSVNQQQLTVEDIPAHDFDSVAISHRSDEESAEGTGE